MDDEYYMRKALQVAQNALALGEVPVGCVVVLSSDSPYCCRSSSSVTQQQQQQQQQDRVRVKRNDNDGVIVSHGANQVNATRDATRHAEIVAIDRLLTGGCSSDQLRLPVSVME